MKQWLLFEMSKNSLEEKPTDAPPKGTRWEPQGARAPWKLLKLRPPALLKELAAEPHPLSSLCLLVCAFRVWKP